MICPSCQNSTFHRRHRSLWERLHYGAIYQCDKCDFVDFDSYGERFPIFSAAVRCPRCGSTGVRKRAKLDHIDPLTTQFLYRIQRWLGGQLYFCSPCRLQFYDLRPWVRSKQDSPREETASPASKPER